MDDEGDGDAVCEGDGEGEPERDGVGDCDGRAEADVEREGTGEVAATRDGTAWTGVGTRAAGGAMVGDGLAADAGAVAVASAGLLEGVATLVWVAWPCAAREPVVWACAAPVAAKASIVTLTAATTHAATATAATATPGLARMLLQLACLITRENRASHIHSAWRATRRR